MVARLLVGRRQFRSFDEMRGVAALTVVAYHCDAINGRAQLFHSGYLAVDLFLMLSGFVVAHAYENKVLSGELSVARFVEVRATRLYPLYILGCGLGAMTLLWQAVSHAETWEARAIVISLPYALLLLPRLHAGALEWFAYNPPAWSLCVEWVVNLLYAGLLPHLSNRVLASVALIAASAMLASMLAFGSVIYLPNMTLTWTAAATRAVFEFTVGILLYRGWRAGRLPAINAPAFLPAALFILVALLPATGRWLWADPIVIWALFPAMLVLGTANEPVGWHGRIAAWVGAVSYPVYALHWWLLSILSHLATAPGAPGRLPSWVAVAVVAGIAWAAHLGYDQPVRRRIAERVHLRLRDLNAARPL